MIVSKLARRCAVLAIAALCLAVAVPARAQQPTPGALAAAKELLKVKRAHVMFDPLIPGIIESVKNTFVPTNPGLIKEFDEVAALLRKEFETRHGEVIENFARLYAAKFSEQELKDITAFYKTPVGQKLLNDEPAILDEGLSQAQAWSRKLADEVMVRFRAEMKKRGHDL